MIEKYIVELLETNNRVIIPDFGAFMVKMDAGKKVVSFNDFLKYNDGLLTNHLSTKEKISKDDALVKVRDFVKDLQNTLKTEQKFNFSTLGTFIRDERGGIRFSNGDETVETPASAKAETPSAPKTEIKGGDQSKPNINAGQPLDTSKPKNAVPQGKPTAVKKGTPPPPPGKPPVPGTKKSKKKDSTTTTLIIVAVLVVLSVVGGLFYLNWDEWTGKAEKERLAQEARKQELLVKAEQDSLAAIQAAETQRVQDSLRLAEEAAKQKQLNQKKYYLVAGSFKVEKNAHRFAEELRSKGYNAEVFMQKRDFWRVSYNSYLNRREAFAECEKMIQQDIQVWVLRY